MVRPFAGGATDSSIPRPAHSVSNRFSSRAKYSRSTTGLSAGGGICVNWRELRTNRINPSERRARGGIPGWEVAVERGPVRDQRRHRRRRRGVEQPARRVVEQVDRAVAVEREDRDRDVFDQGLEVAALGLALEPRGPEPRHHLVERALEVAER